MTRSPIFAHAAELWATMRDEHKAIAEAQYAHAVDATAGNIVNPAGRTKGLTSWDVYHGTPATVRAYGTEELRDHLKAHPRLTLASFERQWYATHRGAHTA